MTSEKQNCVILCRNSKGSQKKLFLFIDFFFGGKRGVVRLSPLTISNALKHKRSKVSFFLKYLNNPKAWYMPPGVSSQAETLLFLNYQSLISRQ